MERSNYEELSKAYTDYMKAENAFLKASMEVGYPTEAEEPENVHLARLAMEAQDEILIQTVADILRYENPDLDN